MSAYKTIVAQQACLFTETELQDFIALVRAGGEVGDAVLENNVRNAKCLVFLRQGDCLSGIAALTAVRLNVEQKQLSNVVGWFDSGIFHLQGA